jgi:hypothetical protein
LERILHANVSEHCLSVCPIYKDGTTECSETSAYKIQTPGNYPEENIQHTEHGKSLISKLERISIFLFQVSDDDDNNNNNNNYYYYYYYYYSTSGMTWEVTA